MRKLNEFHAALLLVLVAAILACGVGLYFSGVETHGRAALQLVDTAYAAGTVREDRTQWKIMDYKTMYLVAASGVTVLEYPSTKQFWAADIEIEGGPLRYYYDGRTPTATEGRRMGSNNMLHLESYDEVIKWKGILDAAGSGVTIVITFLGG